MVFAGNKWMLGGVTSFTRGSCRMGGFARTSFYHDWILRGLKQDQSISKYFKILREKLTN
jgi:hypothetical protein